MIGKIVCIKDLYRLIKFMAVPVTGDPGPEPVTTKCNSDMSDEFTSAFLSWIRTFKSKEEVRSCDDLRDGIVFLEILSDIDADYFGTSLVLEKPNTGNWVLRFHNLKRIYKTTVRYYSEVLGKDIPEDGPDLTNLAKSGSKRDVQRFGRLILAIAVQCDRRSIYVERIRSLAEQTQAALMVAIEQILHSAESDSAAAIDAERSKIEQEFANVLAEIEQNGNAYRILDEQHAALQKEHRDLRIKYEELLAYRKDKMNITKSWEVTELRTTVSELEEQLAAKDSAVEEYQRTTSHLRSRVSEMEAKLHECGKLEEELDEANARIQQLEKLEVTVEKYRERLEENSDMQAKLAGLEEQNFQLLDENRALQEELEKRHAGESRAATQALKKQIAMLSETSEAHVNEKMMRQEEVLQLQQQLAEKETALTHASRQIQEFEKAANIADRAIAKTNGDLNSELSDPNSKVELRLRITQLERQLADSINATEATESLLALLDDAKAANEDLQRDFLRIKADNKVLEQKVNGEHVTGREQIETEVKRLRRQLSETRALLDTTNADSNAQGVDRESMQDLRRELDSVRRENEFVRRSWYDIVSRLQLNSITVKRAYENPSSWLARQRKAVDILPFSSS